MNSLSEKRDHSFTLWYFIAVIAYLLLDVAPDVKKYFIWLKPIPVLLLVMTLQTTGSSCKPVMLVKYGLFFGMIGDILLEISGSKLYFQIGVAAFLIGHIFYILAFLKATNLIETKVKFSSTIIITVLYFLGAAGATMTNLHYIWKEIESEQKIGSGIYAGFLTSMTSCALFLALSSRIDAGMKFGSVFIYLGSLLFFISDVTLSERMKNSHIDQSSKKILSYVVGGTYWLGQFLISEGTLKISAIYSECLLGNGKRLQNKSKIQSKEQVNSQEQINRPFIQ